MTTNKDIIDLLNLQKLEVIGSSKDKSIVYKNDIDLQCYITKPINMYDLYEKFKNIFILAKQMKSVYITDFKCGIIPKGHIPLRWTFSDMIHGYQNIQGVKYEFVHSLQQKSVIKIDVKACINKLYIEYSCNYYIIFDYLDTTPFVEKSLSKSLKLDAMKLYKDDKIFKSLKRLYVYYKLIGKKDKVKHILSIINSQLGLLYKQISQLNTVDEVLNNNFKKAPMIEIKYNLRHIQKNLPSPFKKYITNIIKQKGKVKMSEAIQSSIDDINKVINSSLKNEKF